jgi:O-glycosyl hydrolase
MNILPNKIRRVGKFCFCPRGLCQRATQHDLRVCNKCPRYKLHTLHLFCLCASFFVSAPTDSVCGNEELPEWQPPANVTSTAFELGAGKGEFHAWGRGRDLRFFFGEFLPALFERTIVLDEFDADCELQWIFTGEHGGFTVIVDQNEVSLSQRFYDSFAFNRINKDIGRHPEWRTPPTKAAYLNPLRAVTVTMDHKLGLSVALNGRTVLREDCMFDVSRHQLRLAEGKGKVCGTMLQPNPESAFVHIDPATRHQTIMGFGGIATPTAYAQLSAEGKQQWWRLLREYNLLIQREYPIGMRLNQQMDNWDVLADATPHYYGDNFANGEISDFAYIKQLRRLGGKVWFEFWALPPWVDSDVEKYAEAIVRYCQVSKERAGAPPDIVGIQNEVDQSEPMFHNMTLTLRRRLDEAGFNSVRIHMSDSGSLSGGIKRAEKFHGSEAVWSAIDYSATHMYDYQNFFTNPDGFDALLMQWKDTTGNKPFLSTELCINNSKYQCPTYRVALTMGQLYHKNLVLTDAVAICYCWTLLNVVQPSYGWTRSLCVPDRKHGFVPAASSHQLRIFGAYSRRIREGMVRVEAETDANDLLVSAFAGDGDVGTVVILSRSTKPRQVLVRWPNVTFNEIELVDPYHENDVRKSPVMRAGGATEVIVEPGALITLTNTPLGQ